MNADESGKVTMVGVKLEKIYTLPLVEPKREEKTKTR